MRRVFVLMSLLVFMVSLSACNTAEGVGKDIEAAGEGLQDAVSDE